MDVLVTHTAGATWRGLLGWPEQRDIISFPTRPLEFARQLRSGGRFAPLLQCGSDFAYGSIASEWAITVTFRSTPVTGNTDCARRPHRRVF